MLLLQRLKLLMLQGRVRVHRERLHTVLPVLLLLLLWWYSSLLRLLHRLLH
jgi:hypothetical protein